MWEMVRLCMDVSSMHSFMHLSRDKKLQGEFIDYSFNLWRETIRPYLTEIMGQVNAGWRGEK